MEFKQYKVIIQNNDMAFQNRKLLQFSSVVCNRCNELDCFFFFLNGVNDNNDTDNCKWFYRIIILRVFFCFLLLLLWFVCVQCRMIWPMASFSLNSISSLQLFFSEAQTHIWLHAFSCWIHWYLVWHLFSRFLFFKSFFLCNFAACLCHRRCCWLYFSVVGCVSF